MSVDYFLNEEHCCGDFIGGCNGNRKKCGQFVLAGEVRSLRAKVEEQAREMLELKDELKVRDGIERDLQGHIAALRGEEGQCHNHK